MFIFKNINCSSQEGMYLQREPQKYPSSPAELFEQKFLLSKNNQMKNVNPFWTIQIDNTCRWYCFSADRPSKFSCSSITGYKNYGYKLNEAKCEFLVLNIKLQTQDATDNFCMTGVGRLSI